MVANVNEKSQIRIHKWILEQILIPRKTHFNWATHNAVVLGFFFPSQCYSCLTACMCSQRSLWLSPSRRPAFHSPRTSRQRKQPAPLKNKDTICTHQAVCYKNGDMKQWREGETEATDLLTGQLEGANLLSELNIPDRVGMQQCDGPSRSSERREHWPTGAPWGCSCWLIYLSGGEKHRWVLLRSIMIQEMTIYEVVVI